MLHKLGIRSAQGSLILNNLNVLNKASWPKSKGICSITQIAKFPRQKNVVNFSSLTNLQFLSQRRSLHTGMSLCSPFQRRGFPGEGKPPFKLYTFPPLLGFVALIGTVALLFVVLPLVFTFLFPLIIAGIAVFQFKKWQSSTLLGQLHRCLLTTKMSINYKTIWGLQTQMFESLLGNQGFAAGSFRGVMDEIRSQKIDAADSKRRSNEALAFLERRVLEAFKNNELGLRDFFLGSDASTWVKKGYDLSLATEVPRIRGQSLNDKLVMTISYPLFLLSSNQERKLIAYVAIGFLDDSMAGQTGAFKFVEELAAQSKECPMVISVRPARSLYVKQFILKDYGEARENATSTYYVRTAKDGHREFTYRDSDHEI
ncbi:LAQU0S18e00276g1_1 [Lachancea quebecensis]|uniref:LAQU0S18e00276g1_1 n=1 Tax=Lachancea quebecensis TaxID=1654605 RepID=A0A0P1KWN8_9SACH|nr:LAQU0S18e00276g1_1 [Lachancea quebecensis]